MVFNEVNPSASRSDWLVGVASWGFVAFMILPSVVGHWIGSGSIHEQWTFAGLKTFSYMLRAREGQRIVIDYDVDLEVGDVGLWLIRGYCQEDLHVMDIQTRNPWKSAGECLSFPDAGKVDQLWGKTLPGPRHTVARAEVPVPETGWYTIGFKPVETVDGRARGECRLEWHVRSSESIAEGSR